MLYERHLLIQKIARSLYLKVLLISDMTETTAPTLVHGMIPRFGSLVAKTTNQCRKFQSILLNEQTNILPCKPIRSKAYHPLSFSFIERLRCHLKDWNKAHNKNK